MTCLLVDAGGVQFAKSKDTSVMREEREENLEKEARKGEKKRSALESSRLDSDAEREDAPLVFRSASSGLSSALQ